MKKSAILALSAFLFSGLLSCSKKSGPSSPPAKSESVSIKITLNPVITTSQGDFIATCLALLPNGGYATWVVNGTTRSGENTISLTQTDFQNGVVTLSTTSNVASANLDISGATTAQSPYTVTVVPNINGTVTDSTFLTVTSTMQRSYSF